jgi:hypothetical protein
VKTVIAPALLGLAAALTAGGAGAATVSTCGPNVCYEYDNAQAAIALTGLPTRVGDAMTFLAPSFAALSQNGGGWVTVGGPAGYFIFDRVYTLHAGDEITTFTVVEEFDYEIITDGSVEAALYTLALSNIVGTDVTSTISSFTDAGDTGGPLVDMIAAQLFPAAAFTGPATDMSVGIQNTLRAYTDAAGQLAFIQKKFTLATSTVMNTTVVPVPAAVWLLGSALGALRIARRASR